MLTGSKLAHLQELAEERAEFQNLRRRQLVEKFTEMSRRREADLAALKDDEALCEFVRTLSRRTIRRMYLAQQSADALLEH